MGKGSKQRPTAKEFWTNWDAIWGEKEERSEDEDMCFKYQCYKCGGLDISEVHQEIEINHEPFGDQIVERTESWLTCEHCGGDVEQVH